MTCDPFFWPATPRYPTVRSTSLGSRRFRLRVAGLLETKRLAAGAPATVPAVRLVVRQLEGAGAR
jgi:hypothetical protein